MTTPPGPLFHYCSSETFLKILGSGQILASALALSNDTMEGKWIEKILSQLCAGDDLLAQHETEILNRFQWAAQNFMGLGFCLSEAGDLLSQWRGYADDGLGVSIGFNPEALNHIARQSRGCLQKVVYDEAQQIDQQRVLVDRIKRHVAAGALESKVGASMKDVVRIDDASIGLTQTLIHSTPGNYNLKNPAFREEQEWRLVNPNATLDSAGIEFLARGDRISPIMRYDLKCTDIPVILEVILGPKNITPGDVISAALTKFGFNNVKVSRSSATYR